MRRKGPRRGRARGPVVAIVAAAGAGRRAALDQPKQFATAGGRTLLEIAVSSLEEHPAVDAIVVVAPSRWVRRSAALLARHAKVAAVVAGGARRQDSVRRGLEAAPARGAAVILVHDAARPLPPRAVVGAVIREARRSGAAVPGMAPADTVKEVGRGGLVERTIPRDRLRLIQTPQGFEAGRLRLAYRAAAVEGLDATDDASIVEAAGYPVKVVEGSPLNFKVTTAEDVDRVRAILRSE